MSFGLLIYGFARPLVDWDAIAYIGSAAYVVNPDAAAARNLAYASVQRVVTPERFAELVSGEYRAAVYTDSGAFALQFPFYLVKPGYVLALVAGKRLGIDYVVSIKALSVVPAFLAGLLLLLWGLAHRRSALTVGIVATLWLLLRLPHLARLPTPDALSVLLVGLSFVALFSSDRVAPATAFLLGATLVRSDNGLLWMATAGAMFLLGRARWERAAWVMSLASAGAVTWGIRQSAGAYPWNVQFHHSFIGYLVDPRVGLEPISVASYVGVILRQTLAIANDPTASAFTMMTVIVMGAAISLREEKLALALIATSVSYGVRFMLHPEGGMRLYAPAFVVTALVVLQLTARLRLREP
jgi:hypothetical protein